MLGGQAAYTKLVELSLTSSTPLSLGGYDTLPSRRLGAGEVPEPLRTQSVKGAVRWWTRALIAGALYNGGLNGKRLISRTLDLSGLVWGSSSKGSSGLRVRTRLDSIQRISYGEASLLSRHPRFILLKLGGRRLRPEELFRKIRGSIILEKAVWSRLTSNAWLLGVYSLALSLTLGCLGKASRRGLGCFNISVSEGSPGMRSLVYKAMTGSPEELVKASFRTATQLAGMGSSVGSQALPSIPAIAPQVFRLFRCRLSGGGPLGAAVQFSRCTTRSHRGDGLVARRMAWILGLPRSQKGTGYTPRDPGVDRRASPIIFSVHNAWAYMSVFYSRDWPSRIRWRGSGTETTLDIDDDVIRQALDAAIDALQACMEKNDLHCEEVRRW